MTLAHVGLAGIVIFGAMAVFSALGVIVGLLCIPEDEYERELADRDQLQSIIEWREKNK